MRRLPFKNNLQIGSWYIGAGNKPSVISQKPGKAFSKIREAYRDYESGKSKGNSAAPVKLSQQEKNEIRARLQRHYKKRFYQQIIAIFIALILTVGLLWLIAEFTKERIKAIF